MLIAMNASFVISDEFYPDSTLSFFEREERLKHTISLNATPMNILGNPLNVSSIENLGENYYRIRVLTPANIRIGNIDVRFFGAGARIDIKNEEIQQFAAEGLVLDSGSQKIELISPQNPDFYARGQNFHDGTFLLQTEKGIVDDKTPDKIYIHDGKIHATRTPIPESNSARWEVLSTTGVPKSFRKMPLDANIIFDPKAKGGVRYADNPIYRFLGARKKNNFEKALARTLKNVTIYPNGRISQKD